MYILFIWTWFTPTAMTTARPPVLTAPRADDDPLPPGCKAIAHAGLLMVNTVDQTYTYMDPNRGIFFVVTRYNRIERMDFHTVIHALLRIPYHTSVLKRQSTPDTLQGLVEAGAPRTNYNSGVCAQLVILVMTCCRRLNYPHPHAVADALHALLPHRLRSPAQWNMFRSKLCTWVRRIYTARSYDRVTQLIGLHQPAAMDHRTCMVVGATTGKPC